MGVRDTKVETDAEFAAIAHLRQWCHNTAVCPICLLATQIYGEGYKAAINFVASGEDDGPRRWKDRL